MSENSQSLHVKTDDVEGCIAALRRFGMSGFVFRGTHDWLTAVPFGGPEGLLPYLNRMGELSAAMGRPVLAYFCADDFGWNFTLWLPDGRSTSFAATSQQMADENAAMAAAHPEYAELAAKLGLPAEASFDESVLAAVVPIETVRPLLNPILDGRAGAAGPAKAFARAVGLAQFEWLSPSDVTDDPDEARRRGGEEFGT